MPAVSKVGYRQKLQCKCQFYEPKNNLDRVHPRARLGRLFEPRGEDGEQSERQCQRKSKAEHADGRPYKVAGCGSLDKQKAHNGRRA